jgi:hypothetical protein
VSNVKALPGIKAPTSEPNQALVQALEDILESARSGRLQSFMATGFLSDGLRMSCIFPHTNVYEVVGSLEFLKAEYMDNWTQPL